MLFRFRLDRGSDRRRRRESVIAGSVRAVESGRARARERCDAGSRGSCVILRSLGLEGRGGG